MDHAPYKSSSSSSAAAAAATAAAAAAEGQPGQSLGVFQITQNSYKKLLQQPNGWVPLLCA
jgi:hypothetical protein